MEALLEPARKVFGFAPIDPRPTRPGPSPSAPFHTGAVTAGLEASWRFSLDCIDYPMLCLNAERRLVWSNRAGTAELARPGHPLQLSADTVVARRAQDGDALGRAVREALSLGRCRLIAMGEGADALDMAVMPLGHVCAEATHGTAHVLAVLGRREVCPTLTATWFAQARGLTGAESRVLQRLSEGLSPQQIARTQGVALSTVRTHVRNLRSKTGAGSIGALLRQVAALPPMVGRVG